MIQYRPAVDSDVPDLVNLTNTMLAHTKLGCATAGKIGALVRSPKTLVMLAHAHSELIGFVCGVVHESVFNSRLRVTDIGLFVAPEYRSSTAAQDLIAHLEKWAQDNKATEIWLGQTTGDNPRVVERFYNRLGYKTQGFNCLKEL